MDETVAVLFWIAVIVAVFGFRYYRKQREQTQRERKRLERQRVARCAEVVLFSIVPESNDSSSPLVCQSNIRKKSPAESFWSVFASIYMTHENRRSQLVRTEDGHLIEKCLAGDADAFGELIDKYRNRMHALAHRRVSNFHDAQDLTQEAFLIAYQRLETLKRWENFPGWLSSIINNLCNKWWQSQLRRPDREFVEIISTELLDQPSESLHQKALRHESLYEAIATLPQMYRQVLRLYYLDGYKSREIGQALGISKNTVDTRLRRARDRLREEMERSISCQERKASVRGPRVLPKRAYNPLLRPVILFGGLLAPAQPPSGGFRSRGAANAVPLFFWQSANSTQSPISVRHTSVASRVGG